MVFLQSWTITFGCMRSFDSQISILTHRCVISTGINPKQNRSIRTTTPISKIGGKVSADNVSNSNVGNNNKIIDNSNNNITITPVTISVTSHQQHSPWLLYNQNHNTKKIKNTIFHNSTMQNYYVVKNKLTIKHKISIKGLITVCCQNIWIL